MRSLVLLALPALLDGARIAKKRDHSAEEVSNQDEYSLYDQKPLLTMKACSDDELQSMMLLLQECTVLSDNFAMPSDGSCAEEVAVCSKEIASKFQKQFDNVNLVESDAGAYYRGVSGHAQDYVSVQGMEMSDDFYSEWRNFDARMARIAAVAASSGGAAQLEVVGKSLQGRDMKIVRFTGKGYVSGMPKVLLTFNIHAREWIAGMAGVYAVEKLAEKVKSDPTYLDGMEVVMMPMANPDGFIHSQGLARFHRKNMNRNNSLCLGTDLNRNYDFHWNEGGSSGIPCMDNYHGRAAGDEPETKVISKLLEESPMTVQIDIHAFSQLVLSSWGYTKADSPRKAEFKALGTKMQDAIEARHGAKYTEGPIAQTLYEASGSLTDYATSLGALGFCFELRPKSKVWSLIGFAPPASFILPTAEECFDGLTVAFEYAKSTA